MSIPYIPLYVADYEADTAHLSLEEDGAYNRLLRLCWRTPGCSLPDDHSWIMRRLRVDQETFQRAVLPVLDEFFVVEKTGRGSGEARLMSPRLREEYKRVNATSKKRAEAGRKGGRKPNPPETNDNPPSRAEAGQKPGLSIQNQNQNYNQTVAAERASAPADAAAAGGDDPSKPTNRERLLVAMGADPVSGVKGPNGRVLGRQRDIAEAERWSADLQLSINRQCAVIREIMAREGPDFVPNSFAYFTPAMADTAKGGRRTAGSRQVGETEDEQTARWDAIAAGRM